MTDTTFVSQVTGIATTWAQDVNDKVYRGVFQYEGSGIASYAALRANAVVSERQVYINGGASIGNGAQGNFRGVTGGTTGQYVDNGGTIIVPTGGDGSVAWLRILETDLTPEMFEAPNDGVTPASARIQVMVNALSGIGGTCRMMKRYYIDSDITVPVGVVLRGPYEEAFGMRDEIPNMASYPGVLIVASTATIRLSSLSGIKDIALIREGFPFGYTTTPTRTGTSIQVNNPGDIPGTPSPFVKNVFAAGFSMAVASYGAVRVEVDGLWHDCDTGVWLQDSYDISLIKNVRGQSFLCAQFAPQSAIFRSGSNVHIEGGGSSWHRVENCFSYEMECGYSENNSGNNTYFNCGTDGGAPGVNPTRTGFRKTGGNYAAANYVGCQTTVDIDYDITATTAPALAAIIVGGQIWGTGEAFNIAANTEVRAVELDIGSAVTFGTIAASGKLKSMGGAIPDPGTQSGYYYLMNSDYNPTGFSQYSNDPAGSNLNIKQFGQPGFYIRASSTGLDIVDDTYTKTLINIDQTGRLYAAGQIVAGTNIALAGATVATSAVAGNASALPATPAGYNEIYINGNLQKIPFYD